MATAHILWPSLRTSLSSSHIYTPRIAFRHHCERITDRVGGFGQERGNTGRIRSESATGFDPASHLRAIVIIIANGHVQKSRLGPHKTELGKAAHSQSRLRLGLLKS
jgi:hypothetical protein